MTATLLVNDLRAASVRLLTPWRGAWLADADIDLDDAGTVPSGRVALKIGAASLSGTVDPRRSGRFGKHAKIRIVGGADGWDHPVSPKHFHNDAGVALSAVINATAAEVGETVEVQTSSRLGVDFVRALGPASRVLEGLDWYVTPAGKTVVGTRSSSAAAQGLEVLGFEPAEQRADVAADELVFPGMTFTDTRFGTFTARDVDQTFGDAGARAIVWCGDQDSTRLIAALTSLIHEKAGIVFLKTYRYRIVTEGVDGRLTLQSVKKADGVPDVLPISVWSGMAGLSAKFKPGTEVLVEFTAGDPSQPKVRSFDGEAVPLELTMNASVMVTIGADAPITKIGDGTIPAIRAGDLAAIFPCIPTQARVLI